MYDRVGTPWKYPAANTVDMTEFGLVVKNNTAVVGAFNHASWTHWVRT